MDDHVPTRGPAETEQQQLARNMTELLQELRVAQAGVQILFAFLLTLPFSARFGGITDFQRTLYFATLLATAAAAAFLIGPTAYHRIVFRHHARREVIATGSRWMLVGLSFLALAMVGAVMLVSDVLYDSGVVVGAATGALALLFVTLWFAIPLRRRHSEERRGHTRAADEPR